MSIHHFQPTHYYSTIGQHDPVMRIAPGDTLITTAIDAGGYDAAGERIVSGGNPMTGPFFIQSAEPGDRLVIHLNRITPNRASGWSTRGVDPSVVDPEYVLDLALPSKGSPFEPAEWDIDLHSQTITLRSPETRLGRLQLPLDAMLGCFGVAPEAGQSISTATSGPYGGNMDYRGFRAGTTVFLPVFVPGALFFLGDGHASQCDGEIGGTGIEVSMDIEIRVDLVKNRLIRWPRGETPDEIFTVGNARPLDQALRHATTEMIRWLQEDYLLDPVSASLLASQAVSYEVGNVFDPAYTMVCKLKKSYLG